MFCLFSLVAIIFSVRGTSDIKSVCNPQDFLNETMKVNQDNNRQLQEIKNQDNSQQLTMITEKPRYSAVTVEHIRRVFGDNYFFIKTYVEDTH